ncbi:hypothetical protein ACHAWF_017670 [Thalassiosira exigua]
MTMMVRPLSSAYARVGRRRAPWFRPCSASFSSQQQQEQRPPDDSATIVGGPSLLASTGVHRPSPSLFHLPGLRSLPFWTAPGPTSSGDQQQGRTHRVAFNDPTVTAAVQHVEANFGAIRSEYFSAVLGQGRDTDPDRGDVSKPMEPDYDVASKGGEHAEDALHSGTWDWHSYILNGVKNQKFQEICPKTAQVVDDVSNQ